MRKILAVAIAIMALALIGATPKEMKTKEGWPACSALENPSVFFHYMQAIAKQDAFAISFYSTQKKCGPMKGDMRAVILQRDEHIVVVRIHPEGFPAAVVYTVPEALK